MATIVRRATVEDAGLLSSLNDEVQGLHAEQLPWRFKHPGPGTFPPSAAADLLVNPNNLVFVAHIDGNPAGYAYAEVVRRAETSFHHVYETIYLHHIAVHSANRRCGV